MRSAVLGIVRGAVLVTALGAVVAAAHAQAFVREWGSQGQGPGEFWYPRDIGVDAAGHVYVSDTWRVQKFSPDGEWLGQFPPYGSEPGQTLGILGIGVTAAGHVWITDTNLNRVTEFDGDGQYVRHIGGYPYGGDEGQFGAPFDVATDPQGNVYVVDFDNPRVQKFDPEGQYIAQWPKSGNGQSVVVTDSYGHVYTCEHGATCVQRWSVDGAALGAVCNLYRYPDQPIFPAGLATDAAGNMYIVVENYFRMFSPSGELLAQFGTEGTGPGQFRFPRGIAVGPDGAIYVVDSDNSRVEKFVFPPVPAKPTTWGRLKSLYR